MYSGTRGSLISAAYRPRLLRWVDSHIWGAIHHGYMFSHVRFELAKAHHEGGKNLAAQTIISDVYMRQILAGPMDDYICRLQQDSHAATKAVHTAKIVKTLWAFE